MQATGPDWDWDANWLLIRGEVRDDNLAWSFTDPCLTTREAPALGGWLRALATDVRTESPSFTEPNLRIDALGDSDGRVTVEISFSQESAPREANEAVRYGDGHPVVLRMTRAALKAAADQWDRDLAPFPER